MKQLIKRLNTSLKLIQELPESSIQRLKLKQDVELYKKQIKAKRG